MTWKKSHGMASFVSFNSHHLDFDNLICRLFKRRSGKAQKLRVTGFVKGIHRRLVDSLHKGSVTRKMFPFDDIIMYFLRYGVFEKTYMRSLEWLAFITWTCWPICLTPDGVTRPQWVNRSLQREPRFLLRDIFFFSASECVCEYASEWMCEWVEGVRQWEWVARVDETLQRHHNERDSVSDHQPHNCLLNRLFRRGSKKTSKLRVTGLCAGNSPVTGEFPTQRPVTRKTFPFDDIIMKCVEWERAEVSSKCLGGCECGWVKLASEWVTDWVGGWMNGWVSEWVGGRVSE